MCAKPNFGVRDADEGDGQFMIDAFDASLSQLASIGSGGQWGSQPFAERENREERVQTFEQALRYQLTGEGEPIRIFIAETEIPLSTANELPALLHIRTSNDGKKFLAVGSVQLSEGIVSAPMRAMFTQDSIREELEGKSNFIYLDALITDFRAGQWRKGAGAALIEHARQYGRDKGMLTLYLDAWAGNSRKLVKYYENQGFSAVDDFEITMPDDSKWPGTLLRMDITGK
ncbi:acetyltransferase [Xylariaceae sp. FL1651]|nr:acetyltransferase [Xylariaceae sp. FL1651]